MVVSEQYYDTDQHELQSYHVQFPCFEHTRPKRTAFLHHYMLFLRGSRLQALVND